MPAVFLAGFLPMLLVAFAYRELNKAMPDCGTSFTWTVKAFGPKIGWMCGWGLVIATIIVLSNLAGVATSYFWLLAGEISGSESVAALDGNKAVHILTCLTLIAAATAISYRGMTATKGVQYTLVGLQLVVLAVFVGMALTKAGSFETSVDFSWSWMNPFAVQSFAAFTAGLSLSIFMYWGWDACMATNEETTGSEKTPGRAALIAMVVLVGSYLATGIAAQMVVGSGEKGLGLANPGDLRQRLRRPRRPRHGPHARHPALRRGPGLAAASLQTTFIPVARTVLAMATYEALPKSFTEVHPVFKTPGRATVVAGVATGAFYTVMTLVSEHVLVDTIYALGLMICFYYALTAFACVRYFRKELFRSFRDFAFKGLMPLLGGLMLTAVFGKTLYDMWDPAYGSGSAVLGMGSVFVIGVGLLLLGVVIMLVMQRRSPAFFRGEVLTKETPSLVVAD